MYRKFLIVIFVSLSAASNLEERSAVNKEFTQPLALKDPSPKIPLTPPPRDVASTLKVENSTQGVRQLRTAFLDGGKTEDHVSPKQEASDEPRRDYGQRQSFQQSGSRVQPGLQNKDHGSFKEETSGEELRGHGQQPGSEQFESQVQPGSEQFESQVQPGFQNKAHGLWSSSASHLDEYMFKPPSPYVPESIVPKHALGSSSKDTVVPDIVESPQKPYPMRIANPEVVLPPGLQNKDHGSSREETSNEESRGYGQRPSSEQFGSHAQPGFQNKAHGFGFPGASQPDAYVFKPSWNVPEFIIPEHTSGSSSKASAVSYADRKPYPMRIARPEVVLQPSFTPLFEYPDVGRLHSDWPKTTSMDDSSFKTYPGFLSDGDYATNVPDHADSFGAGIDISQDQPTDDLPNLSSEGSPDPGSSQLTVNIQPQVQTEGNEGEHQDEMNKGEKEVGNYNDGNKTGTRDGEGNNYHGSHGGANNDHESNGESKSDQGSDGGDNNNHGNDGESKKDHGSDGEGNNGHGSEIEGNKDRGSDGDRKEKDITAGKNNSDYESDNNGNKNEEDRTAGEGKYDYEVRGDYNDNESHSNGDEGSSSRRDEASGDNEGNRDNDSSDGDVWGDSNDEINSRDEAKVDNEGQGDSGSDEARSGLHGSHGGKANSGTSGSDEANGDTEGEGYSRSDEADSVGVGDSGSDEANSDTEGVGDSGSDKANSGTEGEGDSGSDEANGDTEDEGYSRSDEADSEGVGDSGSDEANNDTEGVGDSGSDEPNSGTEGVGDSGSDEANSDTESEGYSRSDECNSDSEDEGNSDNNNGDNENVDFHSSDEDMVYDVKDYSDYNVEDDAGYSDNRKPQQLSHRNTLPRHCDPVSSCCASLRRILRGLGCCERSFPCSRNRQSSDTAESHGSRSSVKVYVIYTSCDQRDLGFPFRMR